MEIGVIKRCLVTPNDFNVCGEFENAEHLRNSLRVLGRGDFDMYSLLFCLFSGALLLRNQLNITNWNARGSRIEGRDKYGYQRNLGEYHNCTDLLWTIVCN